MLVEKLNIIELETTMGFGGGGSWAPFFNQLFRGTTSIICSVTCPIAMLTKSIRVHMLVHGYDQG